MQNIFSFEVSLEYSIPEISANSPMFDPHDTSDTGGKKITPDRKWMQVGFNICEVKYLLEQFSIKMKNEKTWSKMH